MEEQKYDIKYTFDGKDIMLTGATIPNDGSIYVMGDIEGMKKRTKKLTLDVEISEYDYYFNLLGYKPQGDKENDKEKECN